MEQVKALNALEPFLVLSKSATSHRAAADLVTRATSHPATFLFAELLSTPQIRSLSVADDEQLRSYIDLLRIFSYGTLQSYRTHPTPLPQLNDAQTLKLRQLSLLSLARDCGARPDSLSYDGLMGTLDLPDARSVEEVVISTIYSGLINGTLDPHRGCVRVDTVAPLRDLAPGEIPPMVDALRAWSERCDDALSDLNARILEIRTNAADRQRVERERNTRIEMLVTTAVAELAANRAREVSQTFVEQPPSQPPPAKHRASSVPKDGTKPPYGGRRILNIEDLEPHDENDELMDFDF